MTVTNIKPINQESIKIEKQRFHFVFLVIFSYYTITINSPIKQTTKKFLSIFITQSHQNIVGVEYTVHHSIISTHEFWLQVKTDSSDSK